MLAQPRPIVILLVDDDAMIRTVVDRILQSGGFHPFCVSSGAEALALLRAMPVDLLLTDIMMPGMSGLELARAALALRPRLRVLLISGYRHNPAELAALTLLGKPFSPRQLLDSVTAVLAG
jgi:CheY-like chemotaxis protein